MKKMPPAIFTGTVFGLLQSFGLDYTLRFIAVCGLQKADPWIRGILENNKHPYILYQIINLTWLGV